MAGNAPRSSRRLADPMRRRLEVATAMAWEALVDAHADQALEFLTLLDGRLDMQEALSRYLREMGIIEPMSTSVRTKVLVALENAEAGHAPLQLHEAEAAGGAEEDEQEEEGRWRRFTPGALVSGVRERQRERDETDRIIMLATARAEEEVIGTHVDNAITFAALLDSTLGLDRAVQEYIQTVGLGGPRAQAIFQRTMARLADVHLPKPRHPAVVRPPQAKP
jgi:hypothetical protein